MGTYECLTCLLPHGFDGSGPEHSSSRIERYLQMCDDDSDVYSPDILEEERHMNWHCMMLSTPANYFHALRRQIHRPFRKPLILANPKGMLKLRTCVSTKAEITGTSEFKHIISDDESTISNRENVSRIILCCGQLSYQLRDKRNELGLNNVVITTVEQIAPFPYKLITDEIQKYPNAEIVWAQEEPKNGGCWQYIQPRMQTTLKHINDSRGIRYVGRDPAAAPATGFPKVNKAQVQKLMTDAFGNL